MQCMRLFCFLNNFSVKLGWRHSASKLLHIIVLSGSNHLDFGAAYDFNERNDKEHYVRKRICYIKICSSAKVIFVPVCKGATGLKVL